MPRRLDILVLKYNSFDREWFTASALESSSNALLYFIDFKRLFTAHRPQGVTAPDDISLLQRKGGRLNSLMFPLYYVYTNLLFTVLFSWILLRHRPRTAWIELPQVAILAGLARRAGLVDTAIYSCGDWLETPPTAPLLSRLANNVLFRNEDRLACRLCDMVVNWSDDIGDARRRHWGKTLPRREKTYVFPFTLKSAPKPSSGNGKMCFMGFIREDSGLELLVEEAAGSLGRDDTFLKIIGPESPHKVRFTRWLKERGYSSLVEFKGFVDNADLSSELADCFCGVNLITNLESHTSFTVPGKVVHYLQQGLPVLITEGNGPLANMVREHGLGLVIEPVAGEVTQALTALRERRDEYRANIIRFVEERRPKTFAEYESMARSA